MFGRRRVASSNANSAITVTPLTSVDCDNIINFPNFNDTFSKYRMSEKVDYLRPIYVTKIFEAIDPAKVFSLSDSEIREQIQTILHDMLNQDRQTITYDEQSELTRVILDDILGFGPIEPLLADPTVTDILINGPKNVFVERNGLLETTDVTFVDDNHLMNICQRIVTKVGRRIDVSNPLVDARLPDGSRINIAIPPASVHFISVSIRKFFKEKMTLLDLLAKQSLTPEIIVLLQLITRLKLNVIISGGTGSGKTTMLNAMSSHIDKKDRVVTIEDTAELQLNQPNVVTLETRPPTLEGIQEITMSDLLKNSLRMRPNRIIVGEVRGEEAGELLQAMNTGHSGSMGTIHANSTRDAIMRFETLCCVNPRFKAGVNTRTQIASAIDIIVQLNRMSDGVRRVTEIVEVVGMEGEVVTINPLMEFNATSEDGAGKIIGNFEFKAGRPMFIQKNKHMFLSELEKALLAKMADESVKNYR
ncbi:MAG: CpaF family protein [Richelia sp. RM2_1_2]|nr:CpaF family protein [Richelia sp. RM2_1_2]